MQINRVTGLDQKALGRLDAFERARVRHETNRQRREEQTVPAVPQVVATPVAESVHKEKPDHEAIFEVKVSLPDKEFKLMLIKRHVYSGIPAHRMTKEAVRSAIKDGLMKLLGDIE